MKKVILTTWLFLLIIPSVLAGNPDTLYRGDSRNPEQIINAGGFWPVGHNSPTELQDASIFTHAEGFMGETDHTMYVSTSTSMDVSTSYGHTNGYLYTIHPASNLHSTNAILGEFSPEPADLEYVALGGIPLEQIMGWRLIVSSSAAAPEYGPYIENPYYRPDIYEGMEVMPTEGNMYALAGFPEGHAAWGMEPWLSFAPDGCGGPNRRKLRSDTCENSIREIAEVETSIFNELIASYNNEINSPLKVKLDNSWEACISLFGSHPGEQSNCESAPIVRFTHSGQFQFYNHNNPELPLCLRPSQAFINGKHNWDYMVVAPCDGLDVHQRFKPSGIDTDKADIILPSLSNYAVSLHNGWLIMSRPGYEGIRVEVTNNGNPDYFKGTKGHRDLIGIGLRYSLKSNWWYPKFDLSPTSYTEQTYIYYNRESRILIDHYGRCIISNEPPNVEHSATVQALASSSYCSFDTPYSKWNISLSNTDERAVKIKSDSQKYLMSWHNDDKVFPLFVTSPADNSPLKVSNFNIYPQAKLGLGLYDSRDVLKIYEHSYKQGEMRFFTEDIADLGPFSNKMSSWEIPRGWTVVFYEGKNFTGGKYTRHNSIDYDDVISDKIKSIRIYNKW